MHAVSEVTTEPDIVKTILYGRELIRYWEDERLLAFGCIAFIKTVKKPLHVVLEFSKPKWVDVESAFMAPDPHRVTS